MPFINQPPPPDASHESLYRAWSEALIQEQPCRYLTFVSQHKTDTRVVGVINLGSSLYPELILHVNPYYSRYRLANTVGVAETLSPDSLDITEEVDSLTALFNLQAFGRQPDEPGIDRFFLNRLGVQETGSWKFPPPSFEVGVIAGPTRDHSSTLIHISPANREAKQRIGQGKDLDVIINFADQLRQHLGLDLTPYSRATFERDCYTSLGL